MDADHSKSPEGLLGVLGHMLSGKSLDLLLAAAAATGKLKSFARKFIKWVEHPNRLWLCLLSWKLWKFPAHLDRKFLNLSCASLSLFLLFLSRLNEFPKHISGEGCKFKHKSGRSCWCTEWDTNTEDFSLSSPSAKSASVRALLFDISFLMLCHVVQTYGSEVRVWLIIK